MAYLTQVPYAEYCETPTAYNLPRAMETMQKGSLVSVKGTDVHPYSSGDDIYPAGFLLNDTSPYSLALVSCRSSIEKDSVWVIE